MKVPYARRSLGMVLAACLAACLLMLILAAGSGAAVATTRLEDRHVGSSEQEHGVGSTGTESASAGGAISDAPTPIPVFAISGYKWHDLNADGVYQEGVEDGLNNWTIFIDSNDNGVLDDTEPHTETAQSGSEDGYYEFSGLESGEYKICEVLEDGWFQSYPDPDPDGHRCHSIELNGQDETGWNFGNWQGASVSGYKYEDLNADGKDKKEPRLAGWTIYVDSNPNGEMDTDESRAVTDDNGEYTIEGIAPGTSAVAVREVPQDGWTCTDPDPCYYWETFESGGGVTNKDFGNYRNIRQLTDSGEEVTNTQPAISGNGEWVAFASDGDLDPNGGNADGNPQIYRLSVTSGEPQLATNTPLTTTNEAPSLNGNGTVIAFVSDGDPKGDDSNADGNAEIFVAEPDAGLEITAVTSTTGSIFPGFNLTPSIDDEGLHIAFASDYDLLAGANTDTNLEIFIGTRGNDLPFIQVTASALCTNAQPSLSGNGRFVAFVSDCNTDLGGSNAERNPEIFVAKVDSGSSAVLAITQVTSTVAEVTNTHPSISSMGGRIAFTVDVNGNPEVFVAELDLESMEVSSIIQVTYSDAGVTNAQPSISGSGQHVAFISDGDLDPKNDNGDGNPEVFVAELDLESLEVLSITQVTESDEGVTNTHPSISTLGGHIAFISDGDLDPMMDNDDGNAEVFVATFATGSDIAVQKTASADLVRAGEPLTYTITVRNNLGPSIPTVVLTDTLSSSVPVEKGDLVPTQGSCGEWSDNISTCTLGEIEAGAMLSLTLVITPTQAGVITNTVQVSAPGDPFPDNNEDVVVLWPSRLYLPIIIRGQ